MSAESTTDLRGNHRDEHLDEVLGDYLLAKEQGAAPTLNELRARHPDLAGDLDRFFTTQQQVERAAAPLRERITPRDEFRGTQRYRVVRLLGQGGHGIVYLATDELLHRPVALKVPRLGVWFPSHARHRFLHEAQAAAALDHPNIVPVFEAGEFDGLPYIASAFCPGRTLSAWLGGRLTPVPERDAASLVVRLADAMEHAHGRGVWHRDLKPANIVLSLEAGDPDDVPLMRLDQLTPKITDFGLAHLVEAAGDTLSGVPIGTTAYMSPEQARGEIRRIGPATDVYGLGAILYQLLTGRPPFRGATDADTARQVIDDDPESPRRERRDVSADLEAVALKCLEKDPGRRYRSAAALADDLRRFLDGRPTIARPISRFGRVARWARRDPALATVTGLAIAALTAVSTVSALWAVSERDHGRMLTRALDDAKYREAENYLDRGQVECERGEISAGLLLMARALEKTPANAGSLRHTIWSQIAGWRDHLHPLIACIDTPSPVITAALSPDGSTVWAACEDRTLRRWNVSRGNEEGTPVALSARVFKIEYSPDGTRVLTIEENGVVDVRNAAAGQALFLPLCERIKSAAWGHDGTYLVTAGVDGRVLRWDAATGEPRGEIPHPNGASVVAVCPRSGVIATGKERVVLLWDVAGKQCGPPLIHEGGGIAVAFSPDGKEVLSVDNNRKLAYAWDSASGAPLGAPIKLGSAVRAIAAGPGPGHLFVGCVDRTARLWNLDTGQMVGQPFRHQTPVQFVAASADGRTLLTAGVDRRIRVWRASSGGPFGRELRHREAETVHAVMYMDGGQTILTAGSDRTARIWDAERGEPCGEPLVHPAPVRAANYCPASGIVLTVCRDPHLDLYVRLWNSRTGQLIGRPLDHGPRGASATAFSPDGRTLITGDFSGTVRFWDVETRSVRVYKHAHDGEVQVAVAFHPDGSTAWTAGGGIVRQWDVETREPMLGRIVTGSTANVLLFTPDGRSLLTAGKDRVVRRWDALSGEMQGRAMSHGGIVNTAALDPSGQILLTGDEFGIARLWDVATCAALGPPLPHGGGVTSVAFNPDSRMALTGSLDGTARLWDVSTGRPLGPPDVVGTPVRAVAFSPDGRSFVTAGDDGAARIWRCPQPVEESADRAAVSIELDTGLSMDGNDVIQMLDASQWRQRMRCGNAGNNRAVPGRENR
jgi:WD40 repeat protein/serine/threonine protein kinase